MGKKTAKQSATVEPMALVTRPTSELEPWEQEMLEEAQKSKEAVAGVGGGNAVSIRGGKLKIGGDEVPGGEVAVVILAHTNAKTYYESEEFDPDKPASPVCFAFGKSILSMAPHDESTAKQCDVCKACKWNEFGTSTKGRQKGKRCKDQIRLAFVQGGTLDKGFARATDAELQASEVYTMSVPATSMKACAAYVRSVAEAARRPLYGVFTRIKVEPDDRTQVKVSFECLGLVPKESIAVVRARTSTAEDLLVQPFPKPSTEEKAPAKPAKKGKKDKLA